MTGHIIELDESGAVGEWVRGDRMHPLCNVAGRRWRADDGREGVYNGIGWGPPLPPSETLWWFFPAQAAEPPAKPEWLVRKAWRRVRRSGALDWAAIGIALALLFAADLLVKGMHP